MKKLIVAGVMALGIFSASAQQKIGYIDTDMLIGVMPEAAKADAELKAYQDALGLQGQDLGKEADAKAAQFLKDSATLTPSLKEIKRNEILELYNKVQNWNQIAQEKYNQKAQEKITPIRTKAFEAIKAVAKEKGYGYVLDASSGALLITPPADDLMPFVKAKLGIKDAPATTPTTTPKTTPKVGN